MLSTNHCAVCTQCTCDAPTDVAMACVLSSEKRRMQPSSFYSIAMNHSQPQCAACDIGYTHSMQGYRLETAETAEFKYEKSAKKAAPVGWEAFNQRTKAEAYDKRTDKISVDMEVSAMLH